MTAVVQKVLSMDKRVARGTDSFIDDIVVNEDVVSSKEVSRYLQSYGFEWKPSPIVSALVLGLRVSGDPSDPRWSKDNVLEPPHVSGMSKRDLFSFCGMLLGHYPVAVWLRPACGFL